MEHLFDSLGGIKERLKGKYLLFFLDFDGTLAPIAATPGKAVLSKTTRELLKEISGNPDARLAFISGRALKDIKNKIGLKNVIYSGNHGLEIEGPEIKFKSFVSPQYIRIFRRIKSNLKRKLSSIKGILVEDKGLSLSLHYRLAGKKQISLAKLILHEAATPYLLKKKIRIRHGKKVLEVRPWVKWDKGKIVLWVLAREASASKRKDIFPVYVGDDSTDEDAFKALKDKGLTVFVGEPKDSLAQYYLRDTNEVKDFLKRLWQNR